MLENVVILLCHVFIISEIINVKYAYLNSFVYPKEKQKQQLFNETNTNEPRHDKSNKMGVRPAKTQISLGIRPV